MSFGTLVDRLANETANVMRMLREGATGNDYREGKAMIKLITAEIERRKEQSTGPDKDKS